MDIMAVTVSSEIWRIDTANTAIFSSENCGKKNKERKCMMENKSCDNTPAKCAHAGDRLTKPEFIKLSDEEKLYYLVGFIVLH